MTSPSWVGSPAGVFNSMFDSSLRLFLSGKRVFALHAASLVLHSQSVRIGLSRVPLFSPYPDPTKDPTSAPAHDLPLRSLTLQHS